MEESFLSKTTQQIKTVEELVQALDEAESYKCEDLKEILGEVAFDDAWVRDHCPVPLPNDRYHRRVLHQGRNFEVVLATWPKGAQTLVHNHGAERSRGMVLILKGTLFNQIYKKLGEDKVVPQAYTEHKRGTFIPVPVDLVHAMGNAGDEPYAMSLHIYTPWIIDVDYWDPETLKRIAV